MRLTRTRRIKTSIAKKSVLLSRAHAISDNACPECGAAKGKDCIGTRYKARKAPHRARMKRTLQ